MLKIFLEKLPQTEGELVRQKIRLNQREENLILVKHQGEIFVFLDKCPHQGKSMGKVKFTDKGEVRCEHHGMRFKLTTGENTFSSGYVGIPDLLVYQIKEENGKKYVKIDEEAAKQL